MQLSSHFDHSTLSRQYSSVGHIRKEVYRTLPESLEDLRERIINLSQQVKPQVLQKVGQRLKKNLVLLYERWRIPIPAFT